MTLIIERTAFFMSVQDTGRFGFQRFGVPESGPMDWIALRCANLLVGNGCQAACLEVGFSSATITLHQDTLMAVCGAGYRVTLNSREIPLWMAVKARGGSRLHLERTGAGNWAYLSIHGGIRSPLRMGSRSDAPRYGIGHRLAAGDELLTTSKLDPPLQYAGRSIPVKARPPYASDQPIRVVPGPHSARFLPASLDDFWEGTFTIQTNSDRMGYRLNGPVLKHHANADIVSQGLVTGEIQVPADGQPIVMMPDHPTTGGYACIGTVTTIDLPLLAQSAFLDAKMRFTPITAAAAQSLLQQGIEKIDSSISEQEEPWWNL